MVGAPLANDFGTDSGAAYVFLGAGSLSASANYRNPTVGGFTNSFVYYAHGLPILGETLLLEVDTYPYYMAYLMAYSAPLTMASPWGNILVDFTDSQGELLGTPSGFGSPALFYLYIPDVPEFAGFKVYTQAIRTGGDFDLTNAVDLNLGYNL